MATTTGSATRFRRCGARRSAATGSSAASPSGRRACTPCSRAPSPSGRRTKRWSATRAAGPTPRPSARSRASPAAWPTLGIARGDRVALLIGNRRGILLRPVRAATPRRDRGADRRARAAPGNRLDARRSAAPARSSSTASAPIALPTAPKCRACAGASPSTTARDACRHDRAARSSARTTAASTAPSPSPRKDTAVILYTSGTTGSPKGAMLTHLNIVHSVLHFAACMRLGADDRGALAVPASHVTGLIATIATMVHVGATIVLLAEFKAAELPRPGRGRARHAHADGAGDVQALPARARLRATRSRVVAHRRLRRRADAGGDDRRAGRGAAEPGPRQRLRRHRDDLADDDDAGRPDARPCRHRRRRAAVRRDRRHGRRRPRGAAPARPASSGSAGRWSCPATGTTPRATAASFTAGFWHSGDLGSVDGEGYVRIFDRKKDMLNRGGFKVYSVEVENALMGYPAIVEAAIVARPCPVLGERVHAFVHAPGIARDDDAVRAPLRRAPRRLQGPRDDHLERDAAAAQCQRQAHEAICCATRCSPPIRPLRHPHEEPTMTDASRPGRPQCRRTAAPLSIGRGLAGRGDARRAGADRALQSGAQRLLPRRGRRSAGGGARERGALAAAGAVRRARRRAGLDQGPDPGHAAGRPCAVRAPSTRRSRGTSTRRSRRACAKPARCILGKTTTPEFGCKGETNSPLTGITRNPWNPERDAGRLVGRRGGGGRRRHGAARGRHRRRRQRPHPGGVLRQLRPEAELRPRPGVSAVALRQRRPPRPAHAAASPTRR